MLALVLGRSSWLGMLAGLGYFMFDFSIGGLGLTKPLGWNVSIDMRLPIMHSAYWNNFSLQTPILAYPAPGRRRD